MIQRKIVSIIICSILLYSCNKKASNNSIEDNTISKSELQETKISDITTEVNNSAEPTSAVNSSIALDTTNYFAECIIENIENGPSSLRTIENKLIEAKILENNSPSAYRDFFLNYLFNSQLGNHDYITVYTGEVDKQFYENKLWIATIFIESIKTKDDFEKKAKECLENAATKERFKNSNYYILNNTSRQLIEQIYSGILQEKHPNLSLFEALQKELPSSLFTNLDTRVGCYLYLLSSLSEYTNKKMELQRKRK